MVDSYDKAMERLEQIVQELEQAKALNMSDYQQKTEEAKELLMFCQEQLTKWECKMDELLSSRNE
jgi:exodeoxyribonuclease VII small subunit